MLAADPTETIHDRISKLVKDIQNSELALCRELAELDRCGAWRSHASSMTEYINNIEILGRGKGRDLLRIGQALPRLPRLEAAMADGRVQWTKAREVAKVATPDTEAEWVDRAETWTARQLERAVVQARTEADPSDPPPADPPPVESVVFRFEVDPEEAQLVRAAFALLRARSGDEERKDLSSADLLVQMAEQVVATDAPDQGLSAERFQTVLQKCPDCEHVQQVGLPDDETAVVTPAQRARAACDSLVVDMRPGRQGRANKTVTDRVRRLVLDRDNHHCAVPGCSNRLWIEVHHVVHQQHRGPHSVDNLTALCHAHHKMIHEGHLHVEMDRHGHPVFDWPRV